MFNVIYFVNIITTCVTNKREQLIQIQRQRGVDLRRDGEHEVRQRKLFLNSTFD